VAIVKPHPWAGYSGLVVCRAEWMSRPAVVVQLDAGRRALLVAPTWHYADEAAAGSPDAPTPA